MEPTVGVPGIAAIFDRFERWLRIVYPGLLFWALLPLVIVAKVPEQPRFLDPWPGFYKSFSSFAQVALVVTSGLFFYIAERYVVHEPFLAWVLGRFGVGAAVNFGERHHDLPKSNAYSVANGRLLWTRFGKRPFDPEEAGERAETRFDNYMASRMAWIHSIGSTWLLGLVMAVIGLFNPGSSFRTLGPWGAAYGVTTLALFGFWCWHVVIAARGEQAHYVAQKTPNDWHEYVNLYP